MYGGAFHCDKCGYMMAHYGSEDTRRLACVKCDGWMHLKENFYRNKKRIIMPTTIFYIALVLFTSAPFNFFWLLIAIIFDLVVSSNLSDDTER